MMRHSFALALALALVGCVADDSEDVLEFEQNLPEPMSGKSDEPRQCGNESCPPLLCGYDTSVTGQQATRSCAEADGRPNTFVKASVSGSTSAAFDSRENPYVPLASLNNVLIYGCELWDYTDGNYDGLEIEYKELIHSSFVVDPNDPTRTKKHFGLYIGPFAGPGSYRASGFYRAAHDATRFGGRDACSADVTVDATGTLAGTFTCTLPGPAQSGASVSVAGSWSCAKNAMRPIFSKWAAAPL